MSGEEINEMANVKEMTDLDLLDYHSLHTQFACSSIVMLNEAMNTDNDLESLAGHFQNILVEIEKRLKYVKVIGDEFHRRLEENGKEKAA